MVLNQNLKERKLINKIMYYIFIKEVGSVKNHADAMIFHTAICAAGVTK